MASYPLKEVYTSSNNVYVVITDKDSKYLDFADDTFKLLASCTTPYLALTEKTDGGGAGQSHYVGTLDLSKINKTLNAKFGVSAEYFVRSGATPAPLTDTAISYLQKIATQSAELGEDEQDIQFLPVFTTTSGTTMRAIVSATRNGRPVDIYALDSSATCTITAREHGSGVDLYTTSATTVGSNGYFTVTQSTPGYTTDRGYQHTIAITCAGTTTTFQLPVAVFG
jgi:hypothetical protein